MSEIRPMTAIEEQALARRIAERDVVARNRLALVWLPLARSLSRRYSRRGYDRDDLVAEAAVDLLAAAAKFRPGRGRFRPRAVRAILQAFWRLVQRERRERARRGPMPDDVAAPRTDQTSFRVEALRGAMAASLCEREREAIRARYGLGLDVRRGSGRSGRRLLQRARGALRKAIEDTEKSP